MASVEEGAAAPANNASIWGQEGQGKFTKKRVIAAGALAGAAILGIGLYFGLKDDSSSDGRTIISGQADPSSEGCFVDTPERVMENMLTARGEMTVEVRNQRFVQGFFDKRDRERKNSCSSFGNGLSDSPTQIPVVGMSP